MGDRPESLAARTGALSFSVGASCRGVPEGMKRAAVGSVPADEVCATDATAGVIETGALSTLPLGTADGEGDGEADENEATGEARNWLATSTVGRVRGSVIGGVPGSVDGVGKAGTSCAWGVARASASTTEGVAAS